METSMAVTGVVIFQEGAQVTRAGTARLATGKHVITVPSLPRYVDEDSVRVTGTGPGSILNVVVRPTYHEQEPSARARELVATRLDLERALEGLHDSIDRNERLLDQLAGARDGLGHRFAIYASAGKAGFPAYENADTALTVRMAGIVERRVALEKEIEIKERVLRACELEIAKTGSTQGTIERKEACIEIDASSDGEFALELSYMFKQSKASWKPIYEIDVGERDGTATMKVQGMVANNTGEDWDGIALVLSTASTRPVSVSEPSPYILRARRIEAPATGGTGGGGLWGGKVRRMEGEKVVESIDDFDTFEPEEAGAEPVELETSTAEVEERGGVRSYRIPGTVSIPAGKESGPFFLEDMALRSNVELFWSSARESMVIARNEVTNGSSVLLPGRIKTYVDGEYAGESSLATTRPGETFKTGVRESKQVRVKKRLLDRGGKKAGIVKDKVTRTYKHRVEVTFTTGVDATLEIVDAIPHTDSTRISVESVQFSIPPDKNEIGVVRWMVPAKGKKDWTVDYEFTVKYAAGTEIVPPLP